MAQDINQCNFVGRLGNDPQRFAGGTPVSNFNIAVSGKMEGKEHTEWVRCVAFNKLAEICNEYLKKGAQVFVSGRLQSRKLTDREGIQRVSTEVVIYTMQMLATGKNGNLDAAQPNPARQQQSAADMEDDQIPF